MFVFLADKAQAQPAPSQASVQDSVNQPQRQPGFAVEGIPVAQATLRPLAYVGIPLDDDDPDGSGRSPLLPPPPSSYEKEGAAAAGAAAGRAGRVHGDVSLGVGRDMAGAEAAARASARRDNLAFTELMG